MHATTVACVRDDRLVSVCSIAVWSRQRFLTYADATSQLGLPSSVFCMTEIARREALRALTTGGMPASGPAAASEPRGTPALAPGRVELRNANAIGKIARAMSLLSEASSELGASYSPAEPASEQQAPERARKQRKRRDPPHGAEQQAEPQQDAQPQVEPRQDEQPQVAPPQAASSRQAGTTSSGRQRRLTARFADL